MTYDDLANLSQVVLFVVKQFEQNQGLGLFILNLTVAKSFCDIGQWLKIYLSIYYFIVGRVWAFYD